MSEKRFELVNGIITDMQDNERMYGIFELVDKLNELVTKCHMLEKENKKLKEENEQLRKKLECCEYKQFLEEQKKIRTKVEKGDLSDFGNLTISDEGTEHWNGVLR